MAGGYILITGASSGIGAALADSYAGQGIRLALVGRDQARLDLVAARAQARGASVETLAADMRDGSRFREFIASLERKAPIELFIANAGILGGRTADATMESGETAREVIEINLLAAVDAIHAVLPGMRRQGRGHIAIVASLAAFSPLPDAAAYSASKAGLLSYGLAMREALRDENIKVSTLCPGYVTTPMGSIHVGERPLEMSAGRAAAIIKSAISDNRDVKAFPFPIAFFARWTLLMPEWVRRAGMHGLRFHVGGHAGPRQ